MGLFALRPQIPQYAQAIHARQHEVEDDHVVVVQPGLVPALVAIRDPIDRLPQFAQTEPEGTQQLRRILDEQNFHVYGARPARRAGPVKLASR